jgi:tetratricopeptide (TPR) repeat protein
VSGPRRLDRLIALAVFGCLLGPAAAPAQPRPVQFPPPRLAVTVSPVPLGLERPALEPPPAPPVEALAVELGRAPDPRFASLVTKPLPAPGDPGGFACAFVAFRRAETLADCGLHRVAGGDYRAAREAFEESLAVDPRGRQAPAAYVWLGELALLETLGPGSPAAARAERMYRGALALAPPQELAMHAEVGLGLLALRRGDPAEAEAALGRALHGTPPQSLALVARYLLGVARLLRGRPADGLVLWDEVEHSGAAGAILSELPFWRGVAHARLGDPERALQFLAQFTAGVPATHPLRGDALVQAGWVALERGTADEAVRRFLEAEAARPRPEIRPQLRAGLVSAYLRLGDSGRARSAARQLKGEAPRDPLASGALLLIADEDRKRGALGEAADGYREALLLPLAPAVEDYARYRLGEALEAGRRLAEAKDRYRALRDRGRDEGIAQRASYRLGLIALRENDTGAARREGEALLQSGLVPELREGALLLVAESAVRGDDPNRAVSVLRLALRDYPGSPRADRTRLALGWALLGDGDAESALREWRQVAGRADLETRALALVAAADVALRQGREAEASAALRTLGSPPPGLPRPEAVLANRGILAVRSEAHADAVQALEPLAPRIRDLGLQAVVLRSLGVAHYHLGQYDQAERQFRRSASVAPQEPSSWLGAGLAALAQGRFAEAEDALGRALYAAVDVATSAWYGRVLVAVQRGDRELFRERGASFVDRFPQHPAVPAVLYGLATAAVERGDLGEAQAWTQRLLHEQAASDYGTDALLRLVAAAGKRPDILRPAYRELLARAAPGPGRADVWLGLSEAALAAGDAADAQQAAEGFLREVPPGDPRTARAYLALIRAQETQGQRDRLLGTIEAFLQQFPRAPEAVALQLTRGQLLFEARRWAEAQAALETAIQAPEAALAAPAHFWLGEVLRAMGDHEAAVAAYLGATYVYRDSPWAARGLQGAAQSYVARQMPREAAIVLRKLAAWPAVDPALAQWARESLARLGPVAADGAPGAPGPRAAPAR